MVRLKLETLVLGQLGTNCYILYDEDTKSAMVTDPAADADRIIDFAQSKGLKITLIALTHGHFDHMLALKELKEKTGAKLMVYEKTERFLQDRVLNLCHYMGIELPPVKADHILKDGDIIDFCGNELKVISTPGHTEDSICYWIEKEKILISGDTLFRFSVGRWDHPTGDMKQEITSLKEKLMVLPDDVAVYPGHGSATTIGEERRGNPYIEY